MEDLEERRVLGDALIERGDPAGEVVQLQVALETLPPEAPVVRRRLIESKISRVLDEHHDAIFGALAPHVQRASRPDRRYPALTKALWRGGFLDAVHLASNATTLPLDAIIAIVRDLPIARFLRCIDATSDDNAAGMRELAARPIPTLRELVLRRNIVPDPRAIELDDAALRPLLEQLEVLHLHHELDYRRLVASRLRSLSLWQTGATNEGSTIPFVAELPALEELSLNGFTIDLGIFARHPRLHTARMYGRFAANFWDALLPSPHVARLRILALGYRLDEAVLEALARHGDRVRHLELIDLTPSYFAPEVRARYEGRLPACVKL